METVPHIEAKTVELPSAPDVAATEALSPGRIFWNRLKRQRITVVGAALLLFLYTMALFSGFIAPYGYERQDRQRFFHPPMGIRFQGLQPVVFRYQTGGMLKYKRVPNESQALKFFVKGEKYKFLGLIPSSTHLFGTDDPENPVYVLGTDQFGRDIFSRVLYGSQISLSIGIIGILLSFSIGMVVGGLSGYFGGAIDNATMRFCELIMSIPGLYLIMSLRAIFPPRLSSVQVYLLIVVILSFISWASAARVVRGMTLSLRERQYVLAARSLGQRTWPILIRHILPNTFSYVIVAATLSVPYYILGEVVLSFLNVGIQEPEASWGNMLSAAQNTEYLRSYPWLLAPGVAIFLTVLAFNFLGDGLRDAVDAKS